ncbi:hypothetical protein ACFV19_26345 [Streptomyces griseoluteus]|uniref:hypothetical protein n=1 Tax=Streptomyces griseoluteus TaxID=29306 RepID=UPI00369E4776
MLAAVCAAVPFTGLSSAHAASSGFGPTQCTNIGNGQLCAAGISGSPAGYGVSYKKTKGSTVTARFYLDCRNDKSYSDNGSFTISQGQTKSFVFSVGNQGACRAKLYDIGNADVYYSPYVSIP